MVKRYATGQNKQCPSFPDSISFFAICGGNELTEFLSPFLLPGGSAMKIDQYLLNQHVMFERLPHRQAFTAQRIAQLLHVPGREMAKTVVIKTGHGPVLAVLPATHRIDLECLRRELGENRAELAAEADMGQIFPDCEPGAIPPFGSLYHVRTVMDETLADDDKIVFEAQSHDGAIRMNCHDYLAVEQPRMASFARLG
jgi:Ala-tRNA(Pro) deacylase